MKGMFTQGIALLTDRPVELSELEALLPSRERVRRVPAQQEWSFSNEALILPLPSVEGCAVAIDVVERPWPDDMGNPQQSPMLFASWTMGHFGPFAYPFGFERACQQAWAWPEAKVVAPRHSGFIRFKTSYVFGARDVDPIRPSDYDPLPELVSLTRLVASLSAHPGVSCYFNPNGELLLSPAAMQGSLAWGDEHDLPPLDAWTNVRFFNLKEQAGDWFLMDTVGMWQLDVPDQEAFTPGDRYDFQEIDRFLRNASLYQLKQGSVIKDGDTMDGPGSVRWRATRHEESFSSPPREVMRWFPVDGSQPPDRLLKRAKAGTGDRGASPFARLFGRIRSAFR